MGLFKMIANALGLSKKEARILVIGLDNSGKTTMINRLKPRKAASLEITPTVGFQVEEFTMNKISFIAFDMSGQGRYRSLWEHYFSDVHAIIFVIDSTDRYRMAVAKEELNQLLCHDEIISSNCPVLFFANKMDIIGAMSTDQIMEGLQLEKIREKPWHIGASNALTGFGIEDGIEWLCEHLEYNNCRALRRK